MIASPAALADTRLTMTDNSDEPSVTAISVHDGKVVLESDGVIMGIYNANTRSFTQVDHQSKTYMVMDDAAMEGVADQMSDMMKQFEEQMANVPPEQRDAMMQMIPAEMRERMQGKKPKAKKADISWSGKSDKVAGYKCKVANVTSPDGEKNTACVAKPGALGISDDDYDALTGMFDTMQEMAARFGSEAEMPNARDLGGIPIRMSGDDGEMTVLQDVNNDKLDGAMFEVPAGYSKRSLTDGM